MWFSTPFNAIHELGIWVKGHAHKNIELMVIEFIAVRHESVCSLKRSETWYYSMNITLRLMSPLHFYVNKFSCDAVH